MSLTPVIKIGVLLGRSPAGRQGWATWESTVVPTGMPLRGLEMSVDMRLGAVSEETAGSDGSDPLAVGLSGPLDFAGRQVRLLQPHMSPRPRRTRVAGRRRRLVCPWLYRRRGQRCGSIAGCWAPCCGFRNVARAGQLASSLALRFPETLVDERWEAVEAPPMVVLRLPVGTVGLFFFLALATAFLNSLRRAGAGWAQDKALRKANSSCLSMVLRLAPPHFTATVDTEQSVKRHKPRMKSTTQSNSDHSMISLHQ